MALKLYSLSLVFLEFCAATCQSPDSQNPLGIRPGPRNIADRVLFVSSYTGFIKTFRVHRAACGTLPCGPPTLEEVYTTYESSPSPTWMSLDPIKRLMFVVDEGRGTKNGSLASYRVNYDGKLTLIQREVVGPSPAHVASYSRGRPALAVAEYGLGGISTWLFTNFGQLLKLQEFFYSGPLGPRPIFQDRPAPHEITTDPRGHYLLVPDRGADLIRQYRILSNTAELRELEPLATPPGTGPRHLIFSGDDTCLSLRMYVLTEIDPGKILVYGADYTEDGMKFNLEQTISTLGTDEPNKRGFYPAEIRLSFPDGRHLMASNRNDSSFNPGTPNAQDSIVDFQLDSKGHLHFFQLVPAGGIFPRTFQLNLDGDLIAVGLKTGLVILSRDSDTGKIGDVVASVKNLGEITCVQWY